MRPFRVEPDEVVHEHNVEFLRFQQEMCMVIHEFFLDGPVEPFHVRVHLRRLGVRVVMREMEFLELLRKVLLELRSVVREDVLEFHGEHHAAEAEEFFRGL